MPGSSSKEDVRRQEPNMASTPAPAPVWRSEPVAVVGMSCRFAGANSPSELWQLIRNGQSMETLVPPERFSAKDQPRTPERMQGRYWGNFLEDVGAFDHGMFKMSPREAQSMDPQQRLILQLTHEVLQNSGHFLPRRTQCGKNVGTFVGVTTDDYRENINGHEATPFSATGSLRAFITGRLNHYYGWNGPAITYDTACSSSAVAIHAACQALALGDCSVALAGGVNTMTSPFTWQNLAAGRFLSPTGPCRPFDAAADGYCRGEGAGLVMLKKLSQALSDNDHVLAVIEASAVCQCTNTPSITVPSSSSQSDLYRRLLVKGSRVPEDVTYVEAHGTGTPVGDPIEWSGIIEVFGRQESATALNIGSIKANIGHTEAASGIAGLIKTILMIQRKKIPPQANFQKFSPNIRVMPSANARITTSVEPWHAAQRIACINNYGAAGSCAMILVSELSEVTGRGRSRPTTAVDAKPSITSHRNGAMRDHNALWPFLACARSSISLIAYLSRLQNACLNALVSKRVSDIAYHVTRQQEQTQMYRYVSTARTRNELLKELASAVDKPPNMQSFQPPVILVFGGQTGDRTWLDTTLVHQSQILRRCLEDCQAICSRLALPHVLPRVFDAAPHEDIVQLQTILFSIQYACATAWLESGLRPVAVVGHSFGQLTALCISGTLSLEDGIRLVAGRAALVQQACRDTQGAMVLVDLADMPMNTRSLVEHQAAVNNLDLACVNGPCAFVYSGDAKNVTAFLTSVPLSHARCRRLGVTHAYHSRLMEPVLAEFGNLLKTISFKQPDIPLELTTKDEQSVVDPEMFVSHLRRPVFFHQAVQRLQSRYESAVWLEAGSNSSVTRLVRQSLVDRSQDVIVPLNLSGERAPAMECLTNATCELWKRSVPVSFWLFHSSQTADYDWVDLPPGQQVKSQHWLQLQTHDIGCTPSSEAPLVTRLKAQEGAPNQITFAINAKNSIFVDMLTGHRILGTAIAPASLYLEVVALAVRQIDLVDICIRWSEFDIQRPMTLEDTEPIFLELVKPETTKSAYKFKFRRGMAPNSQIVCASGYAECISSFGEMAHSAHDCPSYEACAQVLCADDVDLVQGSVLYRLFSRVAEYQDAFKGMQVVARSDKHIVSRLKRPRNAASTFCDAYAMDCFVQPVGLSLNCLQDVTGDQVYLCTSQGRVSLHADCFKGASGNEWLVHAQLESANAQRVIFRIVAYDTGTRRLIGMLTDVCFTLFARPVMAQRLQTLNSAKTSSNQKNRDIENTAASDPGAPQTEQISKLNDSMDALDTAKTLLSSATGVDKEDISNDSALIDLGVDSLGSIELLESLNKVCGLAMSSGELYSTISVSALAERIASCSADGTDSISGSSSEPHSKPRSLRHTPCEDEIRDFRKPAPVSIARPLRTVFEADASTFDETCKRTGFAKFYEKVHAVQERFVCAHILRAFDTLGCNLSKAKAGDRVMLQGAHPRHGVLQNRLFHILEESGLIEHRNGIPYRTAMPVVDLDVDAEFVTLQQRYPEYAKELELIHMIGSALATCISGKKTAPEVVFGDKDSGGLLEAVYRTGPMHAAASLFLQRLFSKSAGDKSFRQNTGSAEILEIGAGTGATTSWIVDALRNTSVDWRYLFTDLGSSLVAKGRRKFNAVKEMDFRVLDIEKDPPEDLGGRFDVVISTNCIHATADLAKSLEHVRTVLKPDGVLLLVEFTQNLSWFDMVFGLFEGWWSAKDGRMHPLADESAWELALRSAGFGWIDWTRGTSKESSLLRIIAASPSTLDGEKQPQSRRQSFVYNIVDGLELSLDVHFPATVDPAGLKRPVALMIHGGGHVVFSKSDVAQHHITRAIAHGLLPVCIDYRLVPELPLHEGAMVDVLSAYSWVRTALAGELLVRSDVCANTNVVFAFGISTGGQLALTLGWTASAAGLEPPNATCVLYGPSDYHDDFWKTPNFPEGDQPMPASATANQSLQDGLFEKPIAAYLPTGNDRAGDGWVTAADARSRIVLWMSWYAQSVATLVYGRAAIPHKGATTSKIAKPTEEEISRICPRTKIERDEYHTPTVFIHGDMDDIVPIAQTRNTVSALTRSRTPVRLIELPGAPHLFDLASDGLRKHEWSLDEAWSWMLSRP